MTSVAQSNEASEKVDLWLRMYRTMVAIRQFEAQVNELYTRALMPGLAHLYIGEEAVAVGVCEALQQTDYITSTHRGHGHCGPGDRESRSERNRVRQRRRCHRSRVFSPRSWKRPRGGMFFRRRRTG